MAGLGDSRIASSRTMFACRIPIACAASRKSWARCSACCAMRRTRSRSRRTRYRTIRCLRRHGGSAVRRQLPRRACRVCSRRDCDRDLRNRLARGTTDRHCWSIPRCPGCRRFYAVEPGLNSGFMIPQVTAAALVAENKQRRIPRASIRFRRRRIRKITCRWPRMRHAASCRWRRTRRHRRDRAARGRAGLSFP